MQLRTMVVVTLPGARPTAKAGAPVMVTLGSGSIAFIDSPVSYRPERGHVHAAVAQQGWRVLVRSLALGPAPYGDGTDIIDTGPRRIFAVGTC